METTKRKEWGSPRSMIQCFAPQEFVAACVEPEIADVIGMDFWADIYDASGYEGSYSTGGDGICNGVTLEHFNSGQTPSGSTRLHRWFRDITLYRAVNNNSHQGIKYTNKSHFLPISGYENADIYMSENKTYIWKDGAPEGTTIHNNKPDKAFS